MNQTNIIQYNTIIGIQKQELSTYINPSPKKNNVIDQCQFLSKRMLFNINITMENSIS